MGEFKAGNNRDMRILDALSEKLFFIEEYNNLPDDMAKEVDKKYENYMRVLLMVIDQFDIE